VVWLQLYEIGSEMLELESRLDEYAQDHMGDITDFPHADYYDDLKGLRNEKLLNLACWFKSVKAESEAYKQEILTLQHKKKVAENKMRWLKGFIELHINAGEKIKDARVALGWRKSEAIVIDDDKLDLRDLPDKVKTITVVPNKTELKNAIKLGEVFNAVELVSKNNLQIK
jgi:hypothetical protein